MTNNHYKIGIIGGLGKFGSFIREKLENLNFPVVVSDRNTPLTNIDVVKKSQVIIIAVPIDHTLLVIDEISPYITKNHVIIDITSIKTPILRELKKTPADLISIHPMFNPSVSRLTNQTIILIPARDHHNWKPKIKYFCQQFGFKIKETTAAFHDKMMALIQVLVHFNTISIGITMSKLGFNIHETLEFTSPIYRMELAMIGRIFAQDSRLYGNIPMFNEHTSELILEHKITLEQVSKAILTKNLQAFMELFQKGSEFFNDFKVQAMEESDILITKLAEYMHSSQKNLELNN